MGEFVTGDRVEWCGPSKPRLHFGSVSQVNRAVYSNGTTDVLVVWDNGNSSMQASEFLQHLSVLDKIVEALDH